jgi:hypothetical protein
VEAGHEPCNRRKCKKGNEELLFGEMQADCELSRRV